MYVSGTRNEMRSDAGEREKNPHCIETVFCRLLRRMAKMDMDLNLKKLRQLSQVLLPRLQKSPINYYG